VESKKNKSKKGTDKSTIKCFACGKMGHYKLKCPKSKSKKGSRKQLEKEADTVLMSIEEGEQPHKDIWIADSATSTHIANSKEGLFNVKAIHKPVKIGVGKLVYATKVGWLKVSYINYVGENKEFVLDNIQYIPGFWVNLFSLMAAMSKGCLISNEGRMIVVMKNGLKIKFNKEIKTKNGFVCRVRLTVKPAEDCLLATVTMVDSHRTVDINKLHKELGHVSKALIQKRPNFMAGCSKIGLKLV